MLAPTPGVTAALFGLAFLAACYRLYLRYQVGIWWDDWLALLAVVSMALLVAGSFLINGPHWDKLGYLMLLGYYIPLWSSRMSILTTVLRLAPNSRQRRILICLLVFFFLEFLCVIGQSIQLLVLSKSRPNYQPRFLSTTTSVTQLITTTISDLILVFLPLWLLRNVHLDTKLRRRLVCVFAMSLFATVCAITRAVIAITLNIDGISLAIWSVIEIFVCLMVCNAYVVFLVLIMRNERENKPEGSGEQDRWKVCRYLWKTPYASAGALVTPCLTLFQTLLGLAYWSR